MARSVCACGDFCTIEMYSPVADSEQRIGPMAPASTMAGWLNCPHSKGWILTSVPSLSCVRRHRRGRACPDERGDRARCEGHGAVCCKNGT